MHLLADPERCPAPIDGRQAPQAASHVLDGVPSGLASDSSSTVSDPESVVAVRRLDWLAVAHDTRCSGKHLPDPGVFKEQKAGSAGGNGPVSSSSRCSHPAVASDWFMAIAGSPTNAVVSAGDVGQLGCSSAMHGGRNGAGGDVFAWREDELKELQHAAFTGGGDSRQKLVILASDVIYDEPLTEALFDVLRLLMPSRGDGDAVFYLALEKRFNFTLKDLSVVASGYKSFLRNVSTDETAGVDGPRSTNMQQHQHDFEGKRIPLSFPQCFRYDRSTAMELWEIRRRQFL